MLFRNKKRYVVHTAGDPVLKAKARPVEAVTPEIRELACNMQEALRVFSGVGIAAPQVGESLRLVVFDIPVDSMGENPTVGEQLLLPRMPLTVINPEIVASSDVLCESDEGCRDGADKPWKRKICRSLRAAFPVPFRSAKTA